MHLPHRLPQVGSHQFEGKVELLAYYFSTSYEVLREHGTVSTSGYAKTRMTP